MNRPLDTVRVLDLGRILSGPFCTMLLADLGADVIKVEQPIKGDPSRNLGPKAGTDSSYFISVNRGKKSITLNLWSKEGQTIFRDLLPHFDVLVENFVPGTMERLGFGYPSVKTISPQIIYASISGFGQTGPYSNKPALDVIVQAMGGIMSVTGIPGLEPMRPGASLGDSIAGLFTSIAIIAALFRRKFTDQGEYIDISMLDCQVTMMENAFARYFATKEIPGPMGSRHPVATPFQGFQANDGNFVIALLTDNLERWIKFCQAIGRPELGLDKRYATNLLRTTNYDQLINELQDTFSTNCTQFWLENLSIIGIPCGPINTIPEVINDPQIKHRRMISEIPHKEFGSWKVANTPFNFGSENTKTTLRPAPELSEHTEHILTEILGITPEAIRGLSDRGII